MVDMRDNHCEQEQSSNHMLVSMLFCTADGSPAVSARWAPNLCRT